MILGRWTMDTSPMYRGHGHVAAGLALPIEPGGNKSVARILADLVDFERLAKSSIKLYITATNVRTGRGHVFKNGTITPDVLLASACLPTMFQAVEIDGEPTGTAAIPAIRRSRPSSGNANRRTPYLVQINPIERKEPARFASEIMNRLNEVSFNAVLLKELRMMALLRQVADPGNSEGAQWAGMRIHRIGSEMLTELGASSKLNAEWEFFTSAR